ncbi:MAG: alpha/beta hydrolase [Mariniphaga sp.]|nr:alpha/beta hydrolase [Mariniphaga sp.]
MKNADIKLTLKGFNYYCRYQKNNESKHDPMVLLSGAFQNMDSWKNFSNIIGKQFPVVLIDLPGSGKSDFLPFKYGGDFLVEAINNMFEKLEIKKANIFAASYGTPTAFNFASKYPEKVSHLIMGGVMKEMPEYRKADFKVIYKHVRKGDKQSFANEVVKVLANCEKADKINKFPLVKRIMRCLLSRMPKEDTKNTVENTKRILNQNSMDLRKAPDVPTLVYTGEYDSFTKPEYCREVAIHFNNATYTTIKNADHLFHIEQTDTVIEMGIRFVLGKSIETLPALNEVEYFCNQGQSNIRNLYTEHSKAS